MKTQTEKCEVCGGDGELAEPERVYPNGSNTVTAYLGKTYPCPECN